MNYRITLIYYICCSKKIEIVFVAFISGSNILIQQSYMTNYNQQKHSIKLIKYIYNQIIYNYNKYANYS